MTATDRRTPGAPPPYRLVISVVALAVTLLVTGAIAHRETTPADLASRASVPRPITDVPPDPQRGPLPEVLPPLPPAPPPDIVTRASRRR